MGGGVLIIGGAASDRIMLKARLNGARHAAEGVAEGAAGLMLAAQRAPDAVLVHLDLPDMPAARLIPALRALPSFGERAVIVLAGTAPPAAVRLAVLAAGADALMVAPDEALLMARLRNLLQQQAQLADLTRQAAPMLAWGLAEAPAGFAAAPGRLAVVTALPEASLRLRRALAPQFGPGLAVTGPGGALAAAGDAGEGPDLWLIDAAGDGEAALRLMTELRARDGGREAGYCLLRDTGPAGEALAFDLGAGDVIAPHTPPAEMAERLRRVLARKRAADRLRALVRDSLRLAMTDPLTGLYNRRFALGRLAAIAAEARQTGRGYAVMVADLDRFKTVNDRWGHAAGDAVLVGVAQRLAGLMRPADMLARIGGEEFVIALPDVCLTRALAAAEHVCHAVNEAPFCLPQGRPLRVTASIGVALSDALAEPVQAVIDRADQALLAAKARGRNRVNIWQTAA